MAADDSKNKLTYISDMVHKIDKEVALQKSSMDSHMDLHESMHHEYRRTNDILEQNTASLNEHMRRTDLLETIVTKMDKRLEPIEREKIEQQAIKAWRNDHIITLAKILGIVGAIVGALVSLKIV